MIVKTTVGPLARGTSVLDAMKAMVLSETPYALLEGAPLKMVDAAQVLRLIASCKTAVDVGEALRSNVDDIAYEVPVIEKDEAPLVMMAKELWAVALKGGSVADTLYVMAEKKGKLGAYQVKEVMDERPPLVDPLAEVADALRTSLMYGLNGYVIVGQKRPFGMITPVKLLKYFSSEPVLSQLEMGDPAPLERAIGDLASPIPHYPSPETKLSDVLNAMIEQKVEVLPVVSKSRLYAGVVKSINMLYAVVR